MGRNVLVCTAAVIIRQGRLLLAQRKEASQFGLKWELPGGKPEGNESLEDCLKRELAEELGVEAEVGETFTVATMNLNDTKLVMIFYLCKLLTNGIELREHVNYAWVSKEELPKYGLAPIDSIVVEQIKQLPQMQT